MVTCGICFDSTEVIGELDSCDHRFCWPCITQWAERETRCPFCKQRFSTICRKQISNSVDAPTEPPAKRHKPNETAAAATDRTSQKTAADVQQQEEQLLSGPSTPSSPRGKLAGVVLETKHYAEKDQAYMPEGDVAEFLQSLYCSICGDDDDEEHLLICDGCDSGYHTYCVHLRAVPMGDWYCPQCQQARQRQQQASRQQRGRRTPAAQQQRAAAPHTRRRRLQRRSSSSAAVTSTEEGEDCIDLVLMDSDQQSEGEDRARAGVQARRGGRGRTQTERQQQRQQQQGGVPYGREGESSAPEDSEGEESAGYDRDESGQQEELDDSGSGWVAEHESNSHEADDSFDPGGEAAGVGLHSTSRAAASRRGQGRHGATAAAAPAGQGCSSSRSREAAAAAAGVSTARQAAARGVAAAAGSRSSRAAGGPVASDYIRRGTSSGAVGAAAAAHQPNGLLSWHQLRQEEEPLQGCTVTAVPRGPSMQQSPRSGRMTAQAREATAGTCRQTAAEQDATEEAWAMLQQARQGAAAAAAAVDGRRRQVGSIRQQSTGADQGSAARRQHIACAAADAAGQKVRSEYFNPGSGTAAAAASPAVAGTPAGAGAGAAAAAACNAQLREALMRRLQQQQQSRHHIPQDVLRTGDPLRPGYMDHVRDSIAAARDKGEDQRRRSTLAGSSIRPSSSGGARSTATSASRCPRPRMGSAAAAAAARPASRLELGIAAARHQEQEQERWRTGSRQLLGRWLSTSPAAAAAPAARQSTAAAERPQAAPGQPSGDIGNGVGSLRQYLPQSARTLGAVRRGVAAAAAAADAGSAHINGSGNRSPVQNMQQQQQQQSDIRAAGAAAVLRRQQQQHSSRYFAVPANSDECSLQQQLASQLSCGPAGPTGSAPRQGQHHALQQQVQQQVHEEVPQQVQQQHQQLDCQRPHGHALVTHQQAQQTDQQQRDPQQAYEHCWVLQQQQQQQQHALQGALHSVTQQQLQKWAVLNAQPPPLLSDAVGDFGCVTAAQPPWPQLQQIPTCGPPPLPTVAEGATLPPTHGAAGMHAGQSGVHAFGDHRSVGAHAAALTMQDSSRSGSAQHGAGSEHGVTGPQQQQQQQQPAQGVHGSGADALSSAQLQQQHQQRQWPGQQQQHVKHLEKPPLLDEELRAAKFAAKEIAKAGLSPLLQQRSITKELYKSTLQRATHLLYDKVKSGQVQLLPVLAASGVNVATIGTHNSAGEEAPACSSHAGGAVDVADVRSRMDAMLNAMLADAGVAARV